MLPGPGLARIADPWRGQGAPDKAGQPCLHVPWIPLPTPDVKNLR